MDMKRIVTNQELLNLPNEENDELTKGKYLELILCSSQPSSSFLWFCDYRQS